MKSISPASVVPLFLLSGTLAFLPASAARAAESGPEKTVINLGTLPGLRYDTSAFSVKPRADVELIFSNKDEMPHNLVITAPDARMEIVTASIAMGASGMDKQFIPDSPKVLWATKIVAANESATLQFKAPATLGDYPYVCTYPGHGFIMFGTMIVTNDPKPPVKNTNAALAVASVDHSAMDHGTKAKLIRTFMPNAGPASIAVGLPGDYSYCWDAGAVRFRYAWKGGYVREVYRQPHRVIGEIFYREEAGFPLRVGTNPETAPQQIQFRGYGFDAAGVPEFEYEFSGVTVRERIEVRDGNLVRHFKTNADGKTVWFAIPSGKEQQLAATGMKEGSFSNLAGRTPRNFSSPSSRRISNWS